MKKIMVIIIALLLSVSAMTMLVACVNVQDDQKNETEGGISTEDGIENDTEESVSGTKIKITVGEQEVMVILADNSATRDLVNRLKESSITLEFSDFNSSEKIAYLDERLDTSNVEGHDPVVGDLTIYTPWGNLAAFYRDTAGYSSSLVLVGKIEESDIEILASQSETFTAVLELV